METSVAINKRGYNLQKRVSILLQNEDFNLNWHEYHLQSKHLSPIFIKILRSGEPNMLRNELDPFRAFLK